MAKVKIVKSPTVNPNAGTSKMRTGDQNGFALYNNQTQQISEPDYKSVPGVDDVRTMYPEVPREEANVEVEKGEVVVSPDLGGIYKVGGNKHSKGGTPIKAKEGSYVISDFIKLNQPIMDVLGFEFDPKADKKKTWADLAKEKVDPKYFNQLASIISDKEKQKEVDPYAYNSAKIKLPELQETISKMALGNELTKGMMGKNFNIPTIAQGALQSLQSTPTEQSTGPMIEAKSGGLMKFFDGDTFNPVDPYKKSATPAGGVTPTGLPNSFNRGPDYLQEWETRIPGVSKMKNQDAQSAIYDYMLERQPQAVVDMWRTYGMTAQGMHNPKLAALTKKGVFDKNFNMTPDVLRNLKNAYVDGMFGRRQLDVPQPGQTVKVPSIGIPPINTNFLQPPAMPNLQVKEFNPEKPVTQVQNNPPDFTKRKDQKLGYDWHNMRDVLNSMRQDPTYYPWSAKNAPVTVNPQFDDPNYYPLLSANNTKQNMISQISTPTTARAVGSYNPDLMMGLISETQRAHGNNLQSAQQATMFNAQTLNQFGMQEANRQTMDYDKTIKTLDNRNTSRALQRNDTARTVDHADNVRDQMRFLLAQNPHYTVNNPWNYSSDIGFLKGKSINDPGTQGPDPMQSVRQYTNQLAEMGYSKDQIVDIMGKLMGSKDNTKITYNGNSQTPAKRVITDYQN